MLPAPENGRSRRQSTFVGAWQLPKQYDHHLSKGREVARAETVVNVCASDIWSPPPNSGPLCLICEKLLLAPKPSNELANSSFSFLLRQQKPKRAVSSNQSAYGYYTDFSCPWPFWYWSPKVHQLRSSLATRGQHAKAQQHTGQWVSLSSQQPQAAAPLSTA